MAKVKSVGIPAAVKAASEAVDHINSLRSVVSAQQGEIEQLFVTAGKAETTSAELRTLILALDRKIAREEDELAKVQKQVDSIAQRVSAIAQSTPTLGVHQLLADRVDGLQAELNGVHATALVADGAAAYLGKKAAAFESLTLWERLRWLLTGRLPALNAWEPREKVSAVTRQLQHRRQAMEASRQSPTPVYGNQSEQAKAKAPAHVGPESAARQGHVW